MKGLQLCTKQQAPKLQDQEPMPTCQQQYKMFYQPEISANKSIARVSTTCQIAMEKNRGSNLIIQ